VEQTQLILGLTNAIGHGLPCLSRGFSGVVMGSCLF
jgi:hypothetical protein